MTSLEWAGKQQAVAVADEPSTKRLYAVREGSVEFDTTKNLYIEGDNLDVLKLLRKDYSEKIKMIYIDPPYNTGNNFIYRDNFFHDDWLSMMYPRIRIAKDLLKNDGAMFISIDDNEVYNLKLICDEIFGEPNFIATLIVQVNPRGRHLDGFVARSHESILIYGRNAALNTSMTGLEKSGDMEREYNRRDEHGRYRLIGLRNRNQLFNPETRPKLFYPLYVDPSNNKVSLNKQDSYEEVWPITADGVKTCWAWGKDKVLKDGDFLIGLMVSNRRQIYRKDYLFKDGHKALTLVKSVWTERNINNDYGKRAIRKLFGENLMDHPKSPALIEKLIRIGVPNDDDIILDFFSGSATTAEAAMNLNAMDDGKRKFIMVQLPEQIEENHPAYKAGFRDLCDLGKERIRRAAKKIEEETSANIDYGFRVYKLQ